MGTELARIAGREAAWVRDVVVAALECAVVFRRFKVADIRSILEAGSGVVTVTEQGATLGLDLPSVPTRSLDAYRFDDLA